MANPSCTRLIAPERLGGHAVGTSQLVNRVAIDKSIQVASVNGPKVTIIQGYQLPGTVTGDGAIRCAYLDNGAVLSGFTLSNGATRNSGDATAEQSGGGALCGFAGGTITNCILTANTAASSGGATADRTVNNCIMTGNFAAQGGGAYLGWLNNCLVVSNSASIDGGGTYFSSIDNCTVAFNSAAFEGGGVTYSGESETNNIIYYNTAQASPNFANAEPRGHDDLQFCCTMPLPGFPSFGCVTNEPLFVDPAGGDFHLQAASPCINAGNNAAGAGLTDLDGRPRISGGTVDLGAYEFQSPTSVISYDWLQRYGLPTDGSADYADSDGDGMNNWQEWVCGTDPTDALSVLRLLSAARADDNVAVTWQSEAGVNYFVERSPVNLNWSFAPTNLVFVGTNALLTPTNVVLLATNILGQPGTTTYTDTNATGATSFYRVGVKAP